jgi:branched-chain amino acid transport system substrate-binding protein
MNDQTRAWSSVPAWPARAMPSMTRRGNYAMILHYLKALEALGGNPLTAPRSSPR